MNLFFSVGEPSGDVHASQLIAELRRRRPDIGIRGFGGPRMRDAGCEIDFQLTDLAVMGLWKVAPLLWRFYRIGMQARRIFEHDPPDAVVLVDFPGFNWWIARYAHEAGIPVFYYLPPQIWAWGSYRVERMRRYVDHVLCCMPFEKQWYAERGVQAEYVGHPIFDEISDQPLDESFMAEQADRDGQVVGILPGSRKHEVTQNFPMQLQIMQVLHRRLPQVRFLVASYKETQRDFCASLLSRRDPTLPVELYVGRTSEIIETADACLMVSGSVSLEMLARKKPAVVTYRSGWVFSWFCRRVLHVAYISLPNLFAERMLMPEYYVVGATHTYIQQMADHLNWWLSDADELNRQSSRLADLCQNVRACGAVQRAADVILTKLEKPVASQAA